MTTRRSDLVRRVRGGIALALILTAGAFTSAQRGTTQKPATPQPSSRAAAEPAYGRRRISGSVVDQTTAIRSRARW
jgi:hypothetical protein